jgi:hypothetical protein
MLGEHWSAVPGPYEELLLKAANIVPRTLNLTLWHGKSALTRETVSQDGHSKFTHEELSLRKANIIFAPAPVPEPSPSLPQVHSHHSDSHAVAPFPETAVLDADLTDLLSANLCISSIV